jgi:hypothetical protein
MRMKIVSCRETTGVRWLWYVAKRTAIQFALALRLDRKDADALLRSAGFALSPAIPEDVIFAEAIDERTGDLQLVSERLHEHGMKIIS